MIQKIEKKGFIEIKADYADYETPAKLVSQNNSDEYIPDATALNRLGNKAYFEISRKIKETEKLVNKWKVLETLANIKRGVFQIFVPHGSMKFTKELVNKYNINAELVKL
ncbi:hypothetical protein E1176_07280 [Fulvivirga sp. RKSG066]|uniref:hypothetical protein n=1 Tax=Fulvivirga aurantia TaxID=2529383 RepID=UPI001625EA92|nr:hypothetical protein [Fulvivirga aurantia]MTI20817.1 hypothetical protein [Fulvivirga aurantia]